MVGVKMKANKENIIEVLDSNISTSELSRKTGIAVMTLSDLRNRVDDSKIDKMQFRTAAKLQKYWEELQMKNIKELNWKEFADLEEVQVDQSTSGEGNAIFYNDGSVQVSVDIDEEKGHDDTTLWEDEELLKELQELAVEALEEEE